MFSKKCRSIRHTHQGTSLTSGVTSVTRRDISCGILNCSLCASMCGTQSEVLDGAPVACLSIEAPIIIPDLHSVQFHISGLEDSRIKNVLFFTTVLTELRDKNKAVYARLQRLISDQEKQCFVFANNAHEETCCVPKNGEGDDEYQARCFRVATQFMSRHICSAWPCTSAKMDVICSDDSLTSVLSVPNQIHLRCLTFIQLLRSVVPDDDMLVDHEEKQLMPASVASRPGDLYLPHLSRDAIDSGIQNGKFFKGKLRISESSCFFGEIRGSFCPRFDRIIVPGRANLNRAINDDIVAVELMPTSEWRIRKKMEESDPVPLTEEEAIARGFQPTGRVVGILELRRRAYCGSIDVDEIAKYASQPGRVTTLFQPKDNRIPRIRISTKNFDGLKDKRLSVVIDEWEERSSFPSGHCIEILGSIGDKEVEAKVILLENDIPHYDFSSAVYDCLPKGTWSVTSEEISLRLDLRDLCVVSVDPLGCRDIDDALHCRTINGNHLEVGVHIADVTHFLHENTPMDEEAAKRSTSVYLVDRRINMLPQLLTENLCSLVEGEDRYAFSILWEFDENLKVVGTWFGKTIIRSRAALYYGDAQKMIDSNSDESEIAQSLRQLMRLSKHFKSIREKDGALFLASEEFKFKIDNAHNSPTDMQHYQTFEANSMIEEWMLYANAAAAERVYNAYPQWTLLRRHQRPAEGAFDALNDALLKRSQVLLDDTTSLTLNQSLERCVDLNDSYFNRLVRILTTRCLRQAEYFSSGTAPFEEFRHFGLALPLYTHFTSPIRRYADVIIHRQLAAALQLTAVSSTHLDADKMDAIATNINYRHSQAQRAGRDSQNLFTGFFLRKFADSVIPEEDGYVVRQTDSHIAVLVPKYGQENLILKDDLDSVPSLLAKVRVHLQLVKPYGDVLRTKLIYTIPDLMKRRTSNDNDEPCVKRTRQE